MQIEASASFAYQNIAMYALVWNHAMHACMGHRVAAQSLLAIVAKLPILSASEHTQKAWWSVIGWGNPRSVETNLPWHGLKITKLPGISWVLEKTKSDLWGSKIQSREIDLCGAGSSSGGPGGVQNMFGGRIWPTSSWTSGLKVRSVAWRHKPVLGTS